MFEESSRILRQNKVEFRENVQDAFGDYVIDEFLTELEKETFHIQETDDESQRESRSIKSLLRELRAIV